MLTSLSKRARAPAAELVDLLRECHKRIRRFLALARRAGVQRDAPRDQVVEACAGVERYFREAFPLHIADEEQSIEPRLRGLSPEVDRALDTMAEQHRHHAIGLERLLRAVAEVRSDPGDDDARDALVAAAAVLEAELAEHLALEESVLFPAIEVLLSRSIQARIADELRQRRVRAEPSPRTVVRNPEDKMTSKPILPDHGVTFDLETIAAELRADDQYVREGQAARTLIRTDDLRIVVIALAAGKTISEHRASVTAAVQTLSGHIRLQLPDRSADVPAGRLLVLGAGLSHDVYAESDSTFLLTLGWPANP